MVLSDDVDFDRCPDQDPSRYKLSISLLEFTNQSTFIT
jgi:hypothetical protein